MPRLMLREGNTSAREFGVNMGTRESTIPAIAPPLITEGEVFPVSELGATLVPVAVTLITE
jgi:hypothetical protein